MRIALLLAIAACENYSEPSAIPTECTDGACLVNPRPHCIREACKSDIDCPSGLICLDSQSGLCARAESSCVADNTATDPSILIRAFETRAMDLVVDEENLRLTWTRPDDALFVTCAVFTCAPVITDRPQLSDSDNDPIDNKVEYERIANADACILELHTTDDSRVSLRMTGVLTARVGPTCTASDDAELRPIVSMLVAACWAYDTFDLIAASELVPIHPRALAANSLIPQEIDCATEPEPRPCYDAARKQFGACSTGQCLPRCTSPRDCERWARATLEDRPEQCEWTCQDVDGEPAGVCAPAS